MKMLRNAPLMADILSAALYDAADQQEAGGNGSRITAPLVQLLKQAAAAVRDEYGSSPTATQSHE